MNHDYARELRKNMTDAERRLWTALRRRQHGGWKFRRQAPVGNYIVDFVSFEKKVIVELDGGQHAERQEYDQKRTQWLAGQGFSLIRFWNHEVFEELDDVLEAIGQLLRDVNTASVRNQQPSR